MRWLMLLVGWMVMAACAPQGEGARSRDSTPVIAAVSDALATLQPAPPPADNDGDGFYDPQLEDQGPEMMDCDDANDNVFPGGVEVCDHADNDCDGEEDEADDAMDAIAWPMDYDADLWGNPMLAVFNCEMPTPGFLGFLGEPEGAAAVWPADIDDCDEGDSEVNPGNYDADCGATGPLGIGGLAGNGIDDNCDGEVDNIYCPLPIEDPIDFMGAGAGAPVPLDMDGDGSFAIEDCDDANPGIYPGAPETAGDGIDQDCDGAP